MTRIKPCPTSPNCVSSLASSPSQKMDAFVCRVPAVKAWEGLEREISTLTGVELVKKDKNYLHYVFRTPILRFKDDVEFELDEKAKQIHFRSASRIGYSDLGANRNRMQMIRSRLVARGLILK